jgi:transcription antitermination factor NusG
MIPIQIYLSMYVTTGIIFFNLPYETRNNVVLAWQILPTASQPKVIRPTSWGTSYNKLSRFNGNSCSSRISQIQSYQKIYKQSTTVTTTPTSTTLSLAYKLWDRLQIEEDDEPMWYLLNCVATNEIDLLRQCRAVFATNMHDNPNVKNDVIKFVVPIEKKTRSHGANKMVTETKVKYPGYVFAKLRLCPYVYEAIQSLDLCRSWMGTVNHKGYKKLPPVPLALNEDEVENFGLENVNEDIDYDDAASKNNDQFTTDAEGIIVDNMEDGDDEEHDEYTDPMYKNVDKKSLKQYKGFKVEDMVKVIQKGKFYNEDGIVRRLKDGQLFVRFYTYGTMFEEWIHPNDVRKLTAEEVLRGLSGSTQPITQKDFDQNNGIIDPRTSTMNRPIDVRDALRSPGISGPDRNRRQDRIADRYKSNKSNEQRDADKNWDWYKEQQQKTKKQDSVVGMDSEYTMRAGSNVANNSQQRNSWEESDVDSQWGRKPQSQIRKEIRRTSPTNANQIDNRLTKAAIDGTADWSALVSPSPSLSSKNELTSEKSAADDFFASLMSDLKKDMNPALHDNHRSQPQMRQPPQQPNVRLRSEPTLEANNANAVDDFFSSLLSDLNKNIDSTASNSEVNQIQLQNSHSSTSQIDATSDDFFASLVSDLKKSPNADVSPTSFRSDTTSASEPNFRPTLGRDNMDNNKYTIQQDDDFFANLEAELESSLRSNNNVNKASKNNDIRQNSPQDTMSSTLTSDLNKKTIPMLKDMLRDRGLKVSGTKSELIDRLSNS